MRPEEAARHSGSTIAAPALPLVAGALAYVALFGGALAGTARLWWTDTESAHGLLLAPVALFLAWRAGPVVHPRRRPWAGFLLLAAAVGLRFVGGLAAELYVMRLSMLIAACGIVVWAAGWRQLKHWWLPAGLLFLSLPLPELVVSALSFPLQVKASQLGAALLEWRHVPVTLSGNVIALPDRSLFVTEACSGLRSLTALLALGLLIGSLWLKTGWGRTALVALAIPVAILLNGVRIFATGFSVHYVSPGLGEGVMHYSEGWFMFVAALLVLAGLARLLVVAEKLRGSHAGAMV